MTTQHAAVWIDHNEAKVFFINAETFDGTTIHTPHHHIRRHPAGPAASESRNKSHPAEEQHFFHDVATSLKGAEEILVVGPANAKLEFMKHVRKHDHGIETKVVGVETADHPTDGQLVAYVRRYFRAADRMRGTTP